MTADAASNAASNAASDAASNPAANPASNPASNPGEPARRHPNHALHDEADESRWGGRAPIDPETGRPFDRRTTDRVLPKWALPAIAVFWVGFVLTFVARHVFDRLSGLFVLLLVSVFVALALEPGVNKLAARGWRRGTATSLILFGVLGIVLLFVVAIGTLVGTQVAELLSQSDRYITDTVDWLNSTFGTSIDPQNVIDDFNDPDGRVQQFIQSQGDEAVRLSFTLIGVIFQGLSIILFTYYLVADGPRLRRVICSRLRPARQRQVLQAWDLAITKTGGYLYSRALLALLSALSHWIVFQALGTQAPIALALWVGLVSQFLPVVGTYLAGILPILITVIDSPVNAAIVLGFIVVYQQIENYLFAPRITARTMELHPAVAFGAALGGAAMLGAIGAILALPGAAMAQALAGNWGRRYDIVDDELAATLASSPGAKRTAPLGRSMLRRRETNRDETTGDETTGDETTGDATNRHATTGDTDDRAAGDESTPRG